MDESIQDWRGPYDEFESIIDKYGMLEVDKIAADVDALYKMHKGEHAWDEAYRRWRGENGANAHASKPLYVIKDSKGNQLSSPNEDESELWDRVSSMEARGKRGLKVATYTESIKAFGAKAKKLNEWTYEEKGQIRRSRMLESRAESIICPSCDSSKYVEKNEPFIDKWGNYNNLDYHCTDCGIYFDKEDLNEWAPNMGECPACGDTSFDTKRGKCTKCSYRESLNESENYKVKFFQVFEAPKSPKENGKMIGQRGTLDDANAFGEGKVGKGNYIIKAVCDDGKTRPIDNDTKSSDYKMVESTSLIDKKFNTLGKAGKPMYLTNDQLNDMQAKFKDYDFEETDVDKSLPNGQKAYVAKKKGLNEDVEYIVPKDVQDKWGNQPILHDEDQWDGKYKTFADMWKGEGYKLEEASYGGAFDIEDDQYFTRDEINEFAYEVCEHLNEIFPTFFDVSDVFIENGVLDLTVQDEDGTEYNFAKRIDMRKIKKPSDLNRAYVLEFVSDIRKQVEEYHNSYVNESLTEDVDTVPIVGPNEGPEFGLSELINTAIQNELETVSEYNTLALNARSEGFEDIAKVIEEINTEENRHIGQLQELLKIVSPNATAIDDGKLEGEEQLSNFVPQEV